MNRGVWLGGGLAAALLLAVVLWPGDAPPAAADPAPAKDAPFGAPARGSKAFLHANWDTTPPKLPAKTRDARAPTDRTAVELPAGLSGVEVALPVPPPEKQR